MKAGISRAYLARIETGLQTPSDDTMKRIEDVLSDASPAGDEPPVCGQILDYGEAKLYLRPDDRPFVVEVVGKSSIKAGARIIVDPRVSVVTGDLALVRVKKSGRIWFGQVEVGQDKIIIDLDASGETMMFSADAAALLGKVTWVDLR